MSISCCAAACSWCAETMGTPIDCSAATTALRAVSPRSLAEKSKYEPTSVVAVDAMSSESLSKRKNSASRPIRTPRSEFALSTARRNVVRGQPSNGKPSGIAMSQIRRASRPSGAGHGYIAKVDGSGLSCMSSSSPRTNPSIDPPSNVTCPSSAFSNSVAGIDTFLLTPKISAKTNRTKRTLCSRANLATSRLLAGRRSLGGVECIDCYRQTQSELIVRAFERARADFADLPQPVEDGMPVDVQTSRCRLDVLSDIEE